MSKRGTRRRSTLVEDACTKEYKIGRTLGEGAFSVVRMGTHKSDKSVWAVKIINQDTLSAADKETLITETAILKKLDHENIVKCREVFDTGHKMYIVMEFMSGGELFDRIVNKEHYTEKDSIVIITQIVLAVKHCHDNGVVHRDLKPENLLFQSPAEDAKLKLADFGLAVALKPDEHGHAACGTPGYVAPEILAVKLKGNKEGYGREVDMWSVGVIVYILLCGFPPFYHENNSVLFELISKAQFSYPSPYWDDVSAPAKDLINKLLVIDPSARLNADQALEHPFIKDCSLSKGSKLVHFKEQMKSFNAKMRMRKAIRAVQFLNRMKKVTAGTEGGAEVRSQSADIDVATSVPAEENVAKVATSN